MLLFQHHLVASTSSCPGQKKGLLAQEDLSTAGLARWVVHGQPSTRNTQWASRMYSTTSPINSSASNTIPRRKNRFALPRLGRKQKKQNGPIRNRLFAQFLGRPWAGYGMAMVWMCWIIPTDHPGRDSDHRHTQSFRESHHRGAGCEVGFVVRHTG